MADQTDNHALNKPAEGELDWGTDSLNPNFDTIEERLIIRDTLANRTNYTAHTDALFLATDTGDVYEGDGANWSLMTVGVDTLRFPSGATARIETPGGGSDDVTIYDIANGRALAEFSESGVVTYPQSEINLGDSRWRIFSQGSGGGWLKFATNNWFEFTSSGNAVWTLTAGGASQFWRASLYDTMSFEVNDAVNGNFLARADIGKSLVVRGEADMAGTDLDNNEWTAEIDEVNDTLEFTVKYSNGTVKTGTVNLA